MRTRFLDFTAGQVGEIEEGLDQSRPGAWRRLRPNEEDAFARFALVAAWRVDMPKAWHRHLLIDHVVIGISESFPFSDPIVIALQGTTKGAPYWPHIDPTGYVCLGRFRYSSPGATRVLSTLDDALTVLNMREGERDAEHRREFLAYWGQLGQKSRMPYLCMLEGTRQSRDIVYHGDAGRGVIFAEDAAQLNTWLSRAGKQAAKVASTTHLIWLEEPLLPDHFPCTGRDVITIADLRALETHMRAGAVLPVLLGCVIDESPVYVCAEIEGISAKEAAKGFRPSKPRPPALIAASFHGRPAVRRSVARADYAWVHGRGKNADVERLRGKKVAMVGCGAIGGFLARSLAQSGVGSLLLIDPETLAPSNVGRHVLGMDAVGFGKSSALAKNLEADFPHALKFEALKDSIQNIISEPNGELADCDLIIAAGISLPGELALNRWRQGLQAPPPLIWTWIEAFAVAGHAVAILDCSCLVHSLDADGEFLMRLTSSWPLGQGHALEAGCGVAYQPYSAGDMMGTINAAHRLSLDVLLEKMQGNVVRSWLGDREFAISCGCAIDGAFDRSFCEISRDWAW